MAEADISAGLSVGDLSLHALAGIKASIDGMTARLDKVLAAQDDYQRHGPVQLSMRAAQVSNAAGDAIVFDLGGPSYGRLWEVRRLVIGGATWSSVVGGTALVTISSTSSADPALTDVMDQAGSLPSPAFYSSGQAVLRNPQRLIVVILSPTASTTYSTAGAGFDVPDEARRLVGTL